MHYHPLGDGRYMMRLDPGDELISSLRQFATTEEVVGGFVSGLGAVSQATLGFLDPEANEYQRRHFDEPMEVGSLTGTLSVGTEDGRPFVHVHAVLAPRELLAYSGHVHEAKIGAVMEIFIVTFSERLERTALPDKPFPWLLLPGEAPPAGGEAGQ